MKIQKNTAKVSPSSSLFVNSLSLRDIKEGQYTQQRTEGTTKNSLKKQLFRKMDSNAIQTNSETQFFSEQLVKLSLFKREVMLNKESQKQNIKAKFQKGVRKLIYILRFLLFNKKQDLDIAQTNYKGFKKRSSFIPFYPDTLLIIFWSNFYQVHLFSSLIIYPFYISFINYQNNNNDTWKFIIIYLDIIFFLEIILNFMTYTFDNNKNLVTDIKLIIKNYLLTWFLFDIISIFPYELVFEQNKSLFSTQDYFQMLKLIRIIRYYTLTKHSSNHMHSQSQLEDEKEEKVKIKQNLFILDLQFIELFKIVYNTLVLTHIFACLWFFAARYENFSPKSWVSQQNMSSLIDIYVCAFYWSIQTVTVVGYGDISSKTSAELNLQVIWMLIGVGFYSFTIGNITNILLQTNTAQESEDELLILDDLVAQVSMPDSLYDQLTNFVRYNMLNNPMWGRQTQQVLNSLPTSLKKFLVLCVQSPILCRISYFQLDVNFSSDILSQTNIQQIYSKETIYRKGQHSSEVYYLIQGEVRITNHEGQTLLTIVEGTIFGEIEAMEGIKREYFCFASKNSSILICPTSLFMTKIKEDDSLFFEMNQLFLRRQILIKDQEKKILEKKKLGINTQSSSITSLRNIKIKRRTSLIRFHDLEDQVRYQQNLLYSIIGQNQQRSYLIKEKFRQIVGRVKSLLKKFRRRRFSINDENYSICLKLFVQNRKRSLQKRQKKVRTIFIIKIQHTYKMMMKNMEIVDQQQKKLSDLLVGQLKQKESNKFLQTSKIIQKHFSSKNIKTEKFILQSSKQNQKMYEEQKLEKQIQQQNKLKNLMETRKAQRLFEEETLSAIFNNLETIETLNLELNLRIEEILDLEGEMIEQYEEFDKIMEKII